MKKRTVMIVIAGLMAFASCKKDEPTETPETQQSSVMDYLPLTPGNYWVYEQHFYDSAGIEHNQTWGNDTVEVISDTSVNNLIYHRIVEHNFNGFAKHDTALYRDSSNCIVNNKGTVSFRLTPGVVYTYYPSYDSTMYYIDFSLAAQSSAITVPAGTFDCLDYQGAVYSKIDSFAVPDTIHKYYSKNVGIIKRTYLLLYAKYIIELDLISYHIQ